MAQDGVEITACLEALNRRLVDSAAIAPAAMTFAQNGSEREAAGLSMPMQILLAEAQTLHSAVCLISREAAPRSR